MDTILLSPLDNIVVLAKSVPEGGELEFDGQRFQMEKALGPGHKLARQTILEGEKIIKYGAPIGSATRVIPAGSHVHLHNMKSDYLPTFSPQDGRSFHSA
jgi:hypothetical protein